MAADADASLDRTFAVLADPTRRRLLLRLVQHGPDTGTRLAEPYPVSRQAIAKHLKALAEAGLVTAEREGREVRYRATTDQLADAVAWLLSAGPAWDRRLDRLARAARAPGGGAAETAAGRAGPGGGR